MLGLIFSQQSKQEEALEMLDSALTLDPRATQVLYLKGKILFSIQEYDDALSCFDSILQVAPREASVLSGKVV
jgi:tetratricopeptide (TPR) repeat protein